MDASFLPILLIVKNFKVKSKISCTGVVQRCRGLNVSGNITVRVKSFSEEVIQNIGLALGNPQTILCFKMFKNLL